jgi:hypothetical protein
VTAGGAGPRARSRPCAGAGRAGSLAAILAAALVLGACGGGGGAGAAIKTKADFIAAGDRICRDRDDRSLALARTANRDGNVARLTAGLADIYAAAIAKLRALALPPGADRPGAQRYVRSVATMSRPVQRMKASAENLAAVAATKSASAAKKAAERLQLDVNTVQAIGDLADQNARVYGFRRCGQQAPATPVA